MRREEMVLEIAEGNLKNNLKQSEIKWINQGEEEYSK